MNSGYGTDRHKACIERYKILDAGDSGGTDVGSMFKQMMGYMMGLFKTLGTWGGPYGVSAFVRFLIYFIKFYQSR